MRHKGFCHSMLSFRLGSFSLHSPMNPFASSCPLLMNCACAYDAYGFVS